MAAPDQKPNEEAQAELKLPEGTIRLPIVTGTAGERALDISRLRAETGYITLDNGFANTGSCRSEITYIDGEKGILRSRGYPIETIAAGCDFIETAMLVIWGELPTLAERLAFGDMLTQHQRLHEELRHHFDGFPPDSPPMAILSAVINAMSCYHPDLMAITREEDFTIAAAKILAKVRTIAAFAYKKSQGHPVVYPHPRLSFTANFLHMMFSLPNEEFRPSKEAVRALRLFFVLHADHEQNCSTSTVRMVGSSGANLFASAAAGVLALWGPLHGGANSAVVAMLEEIAREGTPVKDHLARVKDKKSGIRLQGFGHRVYKNYDPRSRILKKAVDDLLAAQGTDDPLLAIAKELEEEAVKDPYFVERGLYPNVDFYSGILLRAIGIPLDMFPVMFAIGRMPGWIANWYEQFHQGSRIHRPRQIYTGIQYREFTPIPERKTGIGGPFDRT